jgi:hypothetical protein
VTSTTKKPDDTQEPKQPDSHGQKQPGGQARVERRSRDRLRDDAGSGSGSASALSKLKMIERKKSLVPRTDKPGGPFGLK